MTEQPPEREPSWLERLSDARRRMTAKQASGPLWEAELARPTLTPRPPQTRPYDQETDR